MEEPKQILTPEEVSRLAVMAEAELANEYLSSLLLLSNGPEPSHFPSP